MSIKSSYLNNNKYNNTLFNNLRIYFERETKYVSNVSTLEILFVIVNDLICKKSI